MFILLTIILMLSSMFHHQKFIFVLLLTTSVAFKNQFNTEKKIEERCIHETEDQKFIFKYNPSTSSELLGNTSKYYLIHLDWSKILPDGFTHRINQTEVNNYKSMLDTLLHHQIEPTVTLFSGNLPPMFTPLGGWTNPMMVSYFAHYARKAFKLFGERVKTWVTFHEPREICDSFQGLTGDEFPSGTAEYVCAHNILKAHAEAYRIYDKGFKIAQKGRISITLDFKWVEPEDVTNVRHIRIAEQKMQFQFGLYANPILNFGYPPTVINRVAEKSKIEGFQNSRLPEFNYIEKSQISRSFDFLQISYKGTFLIKDNQNKSDEKPSIDGDSGGKLIWTKEKSLKSGSMFAPLLEWIAINYQYAEVVIQTDTTFHRTTKILCINNVDFGRPLLLF